MRQGLEQVIRGAGEPQAADVFDSTDLHSEEGKTGSEERPRPPLEGQRVHKSSDFPCWKDELLTVSSSPYGIERMDSGNRDYIH